MKTLKAKCAWCHDVVEVSHLREFKTCKCGKIGLAEFQIEDIADDIIEEIKRTLGKHIFTSVFGEEEE